MKLKAGCNEKVKLKIGEKQGEGGKEGNRHGTKRRSERVERNANEINTTK